jgi:hypothetical protein
MSERTERGFAIVNFTDANGVRCSLQQSSAIDCSRAGVIDTPGASFVWLGCNDANPREFVPNDDPSWRPIQMPAQYIANTRMHLNAEQVRMLITSLSRWLETGEFDCEEWPDVVG